MMVSEWMVNGNINDFVKGNDDADRPALVCSSPKVLVFAFADDGMIVAAEGCYEGANLYA